MKKQILNISIFFVIAALAGTACKKDDEEPPITVGYVSVNNAALLVPRPVNVLVDGNRVNNVNVLGYLGSITGNFVGVQQGSRTIALRDTSASASNNYVSRTVTVEANKSYSVFTYDTLTAGGSFRMLVLNTDMTVPNLGTAGLRFLHLSPDAPNVDVALLRVNDAGTAYADSVIVRNVPFVGPNPNEATLSNFATIPSGRYHIRVRVAGTFTNVVSVGGPTFTTGQLLLQGKKYTIFARGFVNNTGPGRTSATALGATVVLHNP